MGRWVFVREQKFKMFICTFLLLYCSLVTLRVTATVHDASFIPDATLHVTAQNVSIGGINKLSTLVNGSTPGPELRVPENEVAWIRVYNDMDSQNLTMVGQTIQKILFPIRA